MRRFTRRAAAGEPDAAGADRQRWSASRELIASGQMNASGRLPAERTLPTIGVSRRALRHALDVLEAEGRITVSRAVHLRHRHAAARKIWCMNCRS